MSDDFGALLRDARSTFICVKCTDVQYFPDSKAWRFCFEPQVTLYVECSWRIVVRGAIALGHEDHMQQFGLPSPIDGVLRAKELLSPDEVSELSLAAGTADLGLQFGANTRLELFNDSSGYEGWNFTRRDGFMVVAQGGGQLVSFPPRSV